RRCVAATTGRNNLVELSWCGVTSLYVCRNRLPWSSWVGIGILVAASCLRCEFKIISRFSKEEWILGIDEEIFMVVGERPSVFPRCALLPYYCGHKILPT